MDFSKPSSNAPLPGNVNARDRFQRASYYLPMLPEPKSEREGVASVLAIARNVSVPFGAPYAGFGVYNTEYRTVIDLTNKIYFFELVACMKITSYNQHARLLPSEPRSLNATKFTRSGEPTPSSNQPPQIF